MGRNLKPCSLLSTGDSHASRGAASAFALRASAKPRRAEAREANPLGIGVNRTLDADRSETHGPEVERQPRSRSHDSHGGAAR